MFTRMFGQVLLQKCCTAAILKDIAMIKEVEKGLLNHAVKQKCEVSTRKDT